MARGTPDWGAVAAGVQSISELPTYVLCNSATFQAFAGIETLSLFNPATSTKVARIIAVLLSVSGNEALGPGHSEVKLALTSTPGTGAAVIPVRFDTDDVAAVCEGREDLTVSPTWAGDMAVFAAFGDYDNTAGAGRISSTNLLVELYRHHPGQQARPITLRPGEGIATNVITGAIRHRLAFAFLFTEEPA